MRRVAHDRVQVVMVLATVLYRASHLAVGLFAVVQARQDRVVPAVVWAAALVLSVLGYGAAVWRGRPSRAFVAADVLLLGVAAPFVELAWSGNRPVDAGDWVMLLGTSASAVAAVRLEARWLAGAVGLLVAAHAVVYRLAGGGAGALGQHVISLVSSAALARALWWFLDRERRALDEANARALAAEAHRARYAERLEQHRALHDTVLATLTAIAGGVDAGAPQVRERCAREAAYLRRLVQRTAREDPPPVLDAALEDAVASAEMLGLRVTAQYDRLPELPAVAVAALADAVTEAFNNVRRHAGTGRAWLTVTGRVDGGVAVTVVDRGAGFDPRATAPGLGLRRSVRARMAECGGGTSIDAAPGEGVRVELRWPG
jgi:signal transduction histidine kinase